MTPDAPEEGATNRSGRPRWIGWGLGAILLVGLVALAQLSVGWSVLLRPWTEVPATVLLAATLLVLGSYAIRAVRIFEYFHPATSGRFPGTFRLVLLHNLFNNLLPMRTGEASFPILMAREFQVPFSRSVPGLLYLRILDLHFVLLLGFTVLAWSRGSLVWALALLLAPLPLVLFRIQERLRGRIADSEARWAELARTLLTGLPGSEPLFWKTWWWTAVNWTGKLAVLAWILRAFSPVSYSQAFLGTTTGELSSVLPFHGIAGAGTYEAGVVAGLLPLGVDPESALAGAVNLHLFVLGVSILAGVLGGLTPSRAAGSGGTPGIS